MSLYDRLSSTKKGARALSAARLRYQALKVLHRALVEADITQAELAKRLNIRKSAVNQVLRGDGNMRLSTLAEYLHELGYELAIQAQPVGTQRQEALTEMGQQRMHRATLRPVTHDPSAEPRDFDQLDWRPGRERISISAGG
jgi:transcriptional regulator with XRE-family HTH domain